jgi:NAD(P)-dependent dehydrogenase (short-subunit alcohol dehydrogenase family)
MKLASARAVVSGGASGLGLATAQRVIDAGGSVALLDVNEEQGAASARALGNRALFLKTDVSDEDNVRASMKKAAEFMGGMTLAVNCAGILGPGRTLGRDGPMPAAQFAKVVQINLVGSFIVAKEAANIMQSNEPNGDGERGVIISTASIAAFEGQVGQSQARLACGVGNPSTHRCPSDSEFPLPWRERGWE